MTTFTIHQPARTTGILEPLTGRITAWRQRRTEARMARQVAAANAGRITIAEYLQRLGADAATIRQVEVGLGKAVANAYRAATNGAEPEKTGLALVRGRIYPANAYGWDRLDLISSVAVTFPVVAALIGV
jgi:hypothetical protein